MEGRWRTLFICIWVEESGGNLWREIWRKEERKVESKILSFGIRLACKMTILNMIKVW